MIYSLPPGGQLFGVQHPLIGLLRQQLYAPFNLRLGGQVQLPQAPGIALLRRYPGRAGEALDLSRHLGPPQGLAASGDEHRPYQGMKKGTEEKDFLPGPVSCAQNQELSCAFCRSVL